MFRTKDTSILLEVGLDLLQPLSPFLDLHVYLRLLKMVLKWLLITKNLWFDTKIKSLACSEP